jgi:CDP-diacylglycerol---serine O-phosphatidyltransferase
MSPLRFLRFLAPNAVTSLGMLFGLLSIVATYEHRYIDASWLIIWAVLLDRVDGLVARTLKATSEFGMHMDSFADAINFGIAPAFLVYVSLSSIEPLGFATGAGRVLLLVACAVWVLANVFRLAKFNVVSEEAAGVGKVFFGVPTTLAAGTMVIWFLVLLKYAPAGGAMGDPAAFRGVKLLGGWEAPLSVWGYVPAVMICLAFLMASNLPTPKLVAPSNKVLSALLLGNVFAGYMCGFARMYPDFMFWMPTSWMIMALVWSQFSPKARKLRPPPFLPLGIDPALDDDDDEVGSDELHHQQG